MVKVYFFKINEKFDVDLLLTRCPVILKKELRQFREKLDLARTLIGKLIINKLLIEEGYPQNIYSFMKKNNWGRPYLNNDIHFNISHSGNFVLGALSKTTNIGIDVEEIRILDTKDMDQIFSGTEKREIIGNEINFNLFYSLWTKKEAVIKANGKGLNIPLNEVEVNEETAVCENETWKLRQIFLNSQYSCHLAYKDANEIYLNELTFDDLF